MITKEQILVLVRATPEASKKYGYKVCVAGITKEGSWRRLYPFKFSYGEKLIDFKKKVLDDRRFFSKKGKSKNSDRA